MCKITSSNPAAFSLFALFLRVLFRLYSVFFSRDAGLIRLSGIGYHFEILSSQLDPTKKELISCPMIRLFCIDC